eukprot:TRINITY_DN16750_c0_g1_i1.p1 TRINITY_DN16750_c0_g1~~TRINITY_DN16750_c0_g1_i1.p1  ORF type:complete len:383 (+),score=25.25 TRINITY_DN16750_c0_g1_i1:37-1149(+)
MDDRNVGPVPTPVGEPAPFSSVSARVLSPLTEFSSEAQYVRELLNSHKSSPIHTQNIWKVTNSHATKMAPVTKSEHAVPEPQLPERTLFLAVPSPAVIAIATHGLHAGARLSATPQAALASVSARQDINLVICRVAVHTCRPIMPAEKDICRTETDPMISVLRSQGFDALVGFEHGAELIVLLDGSSASPLYVVDVVPDPPKENRTRTPRRRTRNVCLLMTLATLGPAMFLVGVFLAGTWMRSSLTAHSTLQHATCDIADPVPFNCGEGCKCTYNVTIRDSDNMSSILFSGVKMKSSDSCNPAKSRRVECWYRQYTEKSSPDNFHVQLSLHWLPSLVITTLLLFIGTVSTCCLLCCGRALLRHTDPYEIP